ncbi:glycosyltransferase family 2 protein [Mucilaginibacter sp. HD30]
MPAEPLISIIMPAYNAGKYIAESIKSVLAQTYANWELLIVDDGSTDNTASVIHTFTTNDTRIQYLHQHRGRQGKARNLAIRKSSGELIAFLDADDSWLPCKLQLQWQVLSARPDIDLVFSPGYIVSDQVEREFFYVTVKEWSREQDSETFIDLNQIPILSALVRKEALLQVDLFSEEPVIQNNEDYHLWLKLLFKGSRFLSIPDFLFNYRVHGDQSSKQIVANAYGLLHCYMDLVQSKVIPAESTALKNRLKWLIFQPIDTDYYLKHIKVVFGDSSARLAVLSILSKFLGSNQLLKKIVFRLL